MSNRPKTRLEHILTLPSVWAKLIGKHGLTRKGRRKLTEIMAERHARMDRLKQCGIDNVDAVAFYDVPKPPGKDSKK